jgi:hypothetical protein
MAGKKNRRASRRNSSAPAFVFEPGEKRLRFDDLFSACTLADDEVQEDVALGVLPGIPFAGRLLGWQVRVSSPDTSVQFRSGVGHGKTCLVTVPCGNPAPSPLPSVPDVPAVGLAGTTFGVFGAVTVFYKNA